MRYDVLLVVGLVALAGCAGTGPDGPADPSPASQTDAPSTVTNTATETATATATPYSNTTVRFPAGPKSRPDLPGTFTRESAREYAIRHEYRYSYNDLYSGPETEVGMSTESCGVESTTQRGDGYVVTVRCSGYVNEPAGGETTRTRHSDLPPWTVRYYLDGNSVVREEIE
ncbi:hypothetical protein [Salinigranum sp. GCM10025319]|uniref:hypothetical protein n=1 Tax=Salinigranum sp. GCM10025319 TaxID=3252687 RepID=UPI00360B489D